MYCSLFRSYRLVIPSWLFPNGSSYTHRTPLHPKLHIVSIIHVNIDYMLSFWAFYFMSLSIPLHSVTILVVQNDTFNR